MQPMCANFFLITVIFNTNSSVLKCNACEYFANNSTYTPVLKKYNRYLTTNFEHIKGTIAWQLVDIFKGNPTKSTSILQSARIPITVVFDRKLCKIQLDICAKGDKGSDA